MSNHNESIIQSMGLDATLQLPSPVIKRLRKAMLSRLNEISQDRITLHESVEGVNTIQELGADGSVGLNPAATVMSPKLFVYAALYGSVGVGESYIHGHWTSDDLVDLIRIFLRNRDDLEGLDSGAARLGHWLGRVMHATRHNSRKGSRRNISAHYDLGNDFFSLFLDPTLTYSSAIYPSAAATLEQAQKHKLDVICKKLDLGPDDQVIEIGTGWGGFAIHAAREYGCHVTTTTISREQYEYAVARVAEAGLQDKVTLLNEDYRDLQGQYDKLVSIEMIEAVGHQYFETYVETCSKLLKDEGQALIQAITIADQRFEQARDTVDYIKRFVFPGGDLPSITVLSDIATRCSDLRLVQLEDYADHYAHTLRDWRARFNQHRGEVLALGYPEQFLRLWDYYLAYCEAAFIERAIGLAHVLFVKPGCRRNRVA